ncbi:AtpZ/AtpI family protein [Stakelama marina]|uniref:ATP synthase protein I n=1 Tax=Stakelama marina TaxID=2826939 RepID=A0A8T4IKM4_9SPHN|nr:AtpZ/AtpI family protein [Stakelama marina]MBR0553665.1 AtpZ/AtpI family protein [Stakelama marina]
MADDRQNGTDDLEKRIADAKAKHAHSSGALHAAEGRAETRGWAVGIEFVGAVIVGAVIGLLLDKWLNTAPWLMIVFLALGFAAGLRRAMATSKQFDTDFTNDEQ